MSSTTAEKPTSQDGRQYHLRAGPRDLAPDCVIVGSPERAAMIAETFFTEAVLVADHRGFKAYTGKYHNCPVSVVSSGIGGPSIGTVLPEAKRCGARVFIKVGTCSGLKPDIEPGHLMVSTSALRFDGASDCWALPDVPAVPDARILRHLSKACERLGVRHHLGPGATTTDFNEGQGRPDDDGHLPEHMRERHQTVLDLGTSYYSMEDATLFIWCLTHGQHPCGAIHAVFGNRATGVFAEKGEEDAARAALDALHQFRYVGI